MADIKQITERTTYYQAALSTMGTDDAWDAAMAEYLRCEALSFADLEYGELAKSEKFANRWADHEKQADTLQASNRWTKDYCEPLWEAAAKLVETPAPTLAAALFKSVLIERDEVWENSAFKGDAMAIVQADFARVAP